MRGHELVVSMYNTINALCHGMTSRKLFLDAHIPFNFLLDSLQHRHVVCIHMSFGIFKAIQSPFKEWNTKQYFPLTSGYLFRRLQYFGSFTVMWGYYAGNKINYRPLN